jgi:hypothetical protein
VSATGKVESGAGPRLSALSRFVTPRTGASPGEVCEMCAAPIGDEHSHVVNIERRSLMCSCRACYLLFTREGAAQGKYRAVPDRYLHDRSFQLSDADWDDLQIPVRIAFFFFNSAMGRVAAFYPSPAGATESLLSLDAWRDLSAANPVLASLQSDVEALLVYGRGREGFECFIVPIDACYELTGLIRRRWRGFDGGEEAWRDVEAFFARVRARSESPAIGAAS